MDLKERITKSSLYDDSNRFGKLFCSWVIPYLKKFFKKSKFETEIEIEDLYRCPMEDESETLYRKFQFNYEVLERSSNFKTSTDCKSSLIQRFTKNLMLLSLIQTFRYEALFPFLLFFAQDCLIKPIQPILIGSIIHYFYHLTDNDDTSEQFSNSFLYCVLTAVSLCFSSILLIGCHHPSLTFAMKLSMRVKVIWSSLIYEKCLQLTTNHYNLSSVVNMMTNDVRRFDEFAIMSNYLLIVPIQTVMILTIAWYYIGSSCLATFFAFVILAYIFSYLSKRFANLRTDSVIFTESRLKLLDEVFRHLRAIKIYTLENRYLEKIFDFRSVELKHLKVPLICRAVTLSFSMVSNRVIMYFSFLLYLLFMDSKTNFQPETVFVSVALFERLRYCLTWTLPQAISGLYDVLASCERIDQFLKIPQQPSLKTKNDCTKPKGISVSKLCCYGPDSLKESKKHFCLQDINFDVHSGQILTIVGPVGSGKTTLFLSLLSEIGIQNSDRFEINGTISYASQQVYCLNTTIRENILFGQSYEQNRYQEVLEVCALKHDLEHLPLGDQAIVGECGFTLSGGQKARIGLARALYRDSDIYLLDDPFSSVDVRLARHIYEKCIHSFLRNKCVLIATHQLQFVPQSSRILLLDKGHCVAYGDFGTLMDSNQRFKEYFHLAKHQMITASSDAETVQQLESNVANSKSLSNVINEGKLERLKNDKQKSDYNICKEYWNYLKQGSFGFGSVSLVIASAVLTQASLYACDHWLTLWNKTSLNNEAFLTVYTLIVMIIVTFAILRAFTFYKLCLGASERTHNRIIEKIVTAPINFFDHISVGKLLNNFSKDVGVLDETLPSALFELNLAFSQVFSVVCVIMFLNPYMSMVTFLYLFSLYNVRQYFVSPMQVIRKFEVQSRNHIFTHLSSTMNGLSTIKAFSVKHIYRKRFFNLLNDYTATVFLQNASSRMLCTIIDLISFGYIIFVIAILFVFRSNTNGQLIGFSLGSIFNLIGVAQWAWKRSIDSDSWIISYQNLSLFETLPKECDDNCFDQNAKKISSYENFDSKYSKFEIDFDNLSVYYRGNCFNEQQSKFVVNKLFDQQEHRFVLKNVNLKINFGEKIGICGRSGTGKSTLINALLRFTGYTGEIRINGNEINAYSLTDLRRHISIIPQYPVIFNGSIRENLDLFQRHCDKELWNVLVKVQLRSIVETFNNQLDEYICADSQQMSMGQKQLICLARIMLQNNHLIILDEATANVDFHTDQLIQKTIRQVFANCTVITIAHRLDSIIDCDRILVFDNGFLIEDDSPRQLLQNKNSHFAQLVKQTGTKMASRLEDSVLCSARSS